jgi:hypothetical protein
LSTRFDLPNPASGGSNFVFPVNNRFLPYGLIDSMYLAALPKWQGGK